VLEVLPAKHHCAVVPVVSATLCLEALAGHVPPCRRTFCIDGIVFYVIAGKRHYAVYTFCVHGQRVLKFLPAKHHYAVIPVVSAGIVS